jgi:hypothetical protein
MNRRSTLVAPFGAALGVHLVGRARGWAMADTVESLVKHIASLPHADDTDAPKVLELQIPNQLVSHGQVVRQDIGMSIILDAILGKGYEPDGFTEQDDARIYRYKPME